MTYPLFTGHPCEVTVLELMYQLRNQRKLSATAFTGQCRMVNINYPTLIRWRQYGRLKLFPAFMLALLAGLSGLWLALNSTDIDSDSVDAVQQNLANAVIFPSDYRTVPDFMLIDQNGQATTSTVFKGQWSMMFFGFTSCPDVCPMTLSIIKDVVARITTDNTLPAPQIVFVSVDPKRDTAEKLNSYVNYFDPEFVGLTGELNAILELTRQLNMVVQFTADDENPENYTVDHSASILLIDPDLKVRGSFKYPHESKQIFDDYKTLIHSLVVDK